MAYRFCFGLWAGEAESAESFSKQGIRIHQESPDTSAAWPREMDTYRQPSGELCPAGAEFPGSDVGRDSGDFQLFLSFSRSVLRSICRIWAALVLLPPTLTRTLRTYSASTSASGRVKSASLKDENRSGSGRSGTSMRPLSVMTTRR